MAEGRTYTLGYRRKREGKTNYKKRIKLLSSHKLRFVIRKSLKNIYIQVIELSENGDRVLASASGSELKKIGWKHAFGNLPSAYLIGLILGKKALKKNIKEGIVDVGFQQMIEKNKIYSAIKGLIDAGITISCPKKMFPTEDRINGSHINEIIPKDFEKIKSKIIGEK